MKASRHIGRVGGLAVALGVGAAVLSNATLATADPGSDSTGSAVADRASSSVRAARPAKGKTDRAARGSVRAAAALAPKPSAATPDEPDLSAGEVTTRPVGRARMKRLSVPVPASVTSDSVAVEPVPAPEVAAPAPRSAAHRGGVVIRPAAAGTITQAFATASATRDSVTPPVHLIKLVFTGVAQLALAFSMTPLNFAPPTPATVTPTLVHNGLNLVPRSPATVTSHYGRWSYFPGGLSMVQGEQQFDVVDPSSGETTGTFDALVTRGLGYNYVQLLVKSGDGSGQAPPAGSVISAFKPGRFGRFGWSYSAVPADAGNLISFAFQTPFGELRVPLKFDAAEGIADHTVDNRPMNLTNGYSIAPSDPQGETLTAVTGLLPLFGTVQGHQVFSVYDSTGAAVGNFDGVFTTTADLAGNYTQAILVTANDGTNVGTAAGQVPPVGSVYNIIYLGGFEEYILYSSLPAATGDVVSIVQATPDGVSNVTPTFINASKTPAVKRLSSPQGYTFVPASELVPSGVNGLPPREVEIQGYQQFDVFDSSGTKIGRVDADVTNQWDMFGIYSQAILVTGVTEASGEVPPAGSTFNFAQYGKSHLATVHSTVPTPAADVTSFKILTPLGNIALPAVKRPARDRTEVSYFRPLQSL